MTPIDAARKNLEIDLSHIVAGRGAARDAVSSIEALIDAKLASAEKAGWAICRHCERPVSEHIGQEIGDGYVNCHFARGTNGEEAKATEAHGTVASADSVRDDDSQGGSGGGESARGAQPDLQVTPSKRPAVLPEVLPAGFTCGGGKMVSVTDAKLTPTRKLYRGQVQEVRGDWTSNLDAELPFEFIDWSSIPATPREPEAGEGARDPGGVCTVCKLPRGSCLHCGKPIEFGGVCNGGGAHLHHACDAGAKEPDRQGEGRLGDELSDEEAERGAGARQTPPGSI